MATYQVNIPRKDFLSLPASMRSVEGGLKVMATVNGKSVLVPANLI